MNEQRQEAAASFESPVRGRQRIAQAQRGAEPIGPPWVSVPTILPSPSTENVLGERVEICGNFDPGRRQRGRRSRGSCRWRGLGLPSLAPLGLYEEEAASCHFTNVHYMALRWSAEVSGSESSIDMRPLAGPMLLITVAAQGLDTREVIHELTKTLKEPAAYRNTFE